jgi:hypothetical protein
MWYGIIGDRKCGTVMLGTGNVVRYCWRQEIWYSNSRERKYGTVLLGKGNVIQ